MNDADLLKKFQDNNDQEAFRQLIQKHSGMVISICRRDLGDESLAQDAAQTVFIILAQKAKRVKAKALSSFLFSTSRLVVKNMKRVEARRKKHEAKAADMKEKMSISPETEAQWEEIKPFLNDAVSMLGKDQKEAVIRYFLENKSQNRVAQELGCSEDAVKMRVSRGIKKLKRKLAKKGIVLPGAVLSGLLATKGAEAASVPLAEACLNASMAALAGNTAGIGSLLTVAQGVTHMMMWMKIKMAAVCLCGLAAVGGLTTIAAQHTVTEEKTAASVQNKETAAKNPLAISLRVDPESWAKQKKGKHTRIACMLDVKNNGTEPMRIVPFSPGMFSFTDSNGRNIKMKFWGADKSRLPAPMDFPVIEPGLVKTLKIYGFLGTNKMLWLSEITGGSWQSTSSLSENKYTVSVSYKNTDRNLPEVVKKRDNNPVQILWTGTVTTAPVEIAIKKDPTSEDKELSRFLKKVKYAECAAVTTIVQLFEGWPLWFCPTVRYDTILYGEKFKKEGNNIWIHGENISLKIPAGKEHIHIKRGGKIIIVYNKVDGPTAINWTPAREKAVKSALAPGWKWDSAHFLCPWCCTGSGGRIGEDRGGTCETCGEKTLSDAYRLCPACASPAGKCQHCKRIIRPATRGVTLKLTAVDPARIDRTNPDVIYKAESASGQAPGLWLTVNDKTPGRKITELMWRNKRIHGTSLFFIIEKPDRNEPSIAFLQDNRKTAAPPLTALTGPHCEKLSMNPRDAARFLRDPGIYTIRAAAGRLVSNPITVLIKEKEKLKLSLNIAPVQWKPGTKVSLTCTVRNVSAKPLRFLAWGAGFRNTLEIIDRSGRPVRNGGGRRATRPLTIDDYPLLKPGQEKKFTVQGALHKKNDSIQLITSERMGGILFWELIKGHTYSVKAVLHITEEDFKRYPRNLQKEQDTLWTGKIYSNPVSITVSGEQKKPDDIF